MSFRYVLPVLLVALAACEDTREPTGPEAASSASVTAAAAFTWIQVSPGQAHTCGLAADSLAYCWGWGELGQLGTGASTPVEPSPVAVQGSPALARHPGRRRPHLRPHPCAAHLLLGRPTRNGQLGDGTASGNQVNPSGRGGHYADVRPDRVRARRTPVPSPPPARPTAGGTTRTASLATAAAPGGSRRSRWLGNLVFRHVRAGWDHTCGVTTTDVAYCWGRNKVGQLGDGTDLTRGRPTAGGRRAQVPADPHRPAA